MKEQKKRLVVDTTEQFHHELKMLAVEEKRTISNIIKELLEKYMNEKKLERV